jgi:carbonic anhydrase/acetyltransferase-like protein (isoleucine patch superfamily)
MLITLAGHTPTLAPSVYVAAGARLIGQLTIDRDASVWFNAVIRADADRIVIGSGSNVQDNATVHCDPDFPCLLGSGVTIGHNAIVHACTIGDNVLIGMNATILTGASVGRDSIVGAGALVTEGSIVPAGSLVLGVPAKVVRALRPEEIDRIRASADGYAKRASLYRDQAVAADETPY